MSTGRYFIRLRNGRTFCVEPVDERHNRSQPWGWYEGLKAAEGGAVSEAESIITPENGFTDIRIVANPMDVIDKVLRGELPR